MRAWGVGLLFLTGLLSAQSPVVETAPVCQEMATAPDACLQTIRKLSTHGGLDRALPVALSLHKMYPENLFYRREYAKLLYWKGRLRQAWQVAQHFATDDSEDQELRGKISIAWHSNVLKRLQRTPGKYLRYLHRIPMGEQESYDIQIMTADVYVRLGRMHRALRAAKRLWHRYPESTEAKALVATLHFWNKQYGQSLKLFRQLYRSSHDKTYRDQIQKVEQAQTDAWLEKTDKAITQALKVRQGNRARTLYHQVVDRNLTAAFDAKYPTTHCRVTMQRMAGAGVAWHRSSDPKPDRTVYLEGTFPVADWIVYARAEKIERYGMEDHKLSAELYPILPEGYWGYLLVSKTFDPDFSSRYAVGGHLYREIGKWQWGASLDYGRYIDSRAVTLGGEVAYHLPDGWVWKQKITYGLLSGNYSLGGGVQYHTACHWDFEMNYTFSHERERIPGTTRYSTFATHAFSLSGEYPIAPRLHVVGTVDYSRSVHPDYHSDRKGASLGLRMYW